MGLADKTRTLFAVLGKVDSSYGAGDALSASTDGIELRDLIQIPGQDWIFNGDRPRADGTAGSRRRLPPQGAELSIPIEVESKGRGSAFAGASDVAPDIDVGLRISGHTRTFSTNKQIYAPTNDKSLYVSGVFELYFIGEKWSMKGAFADFIWEGEAGQPAVMSFPVRGYRTAAIADASEPTVTYPAQSVDPPAVINTGFSLNSVSNLILKKFRFQKNQAIGRRRNAGGSGGTGHAGLNFGLRRPVLSVTFEAPPIATFNPYSLMEAATQMACSLTVGTVAGNIQYGSFPQVQIIPSSFRIDDEEEVALYTMDLQVNPSSPTATDDYVIETR